MTVQGNYSYIRFYPILRLVQIFILRVSLWEGRTLDPIKYFHVVAQSLIYYESQLEWGVLKLIRGDIEFIERGGHDGWVTRYTRDNSPLHKELNIRQPFDVDLKL